MTIHEVMNKAERFLSGTPCSGLHLGRLSRMSKGVDVGDNTRKGLDQEV
jgi:hypothetical protein